jgi:hypothetical protein
MQSFINIKKEGENLFILCKKNINKKNHNIYNGTIKNITFFFISNKGSFY